MGSYLNYGSDIIVFIGDIIVFIRVEVGGMSAIKNALEFRLLHVCQHTYLINICSLV